MPEGRCASLRYRLRMGIRPVCGVLLVTLTGLSACRISSPPIARFPEPALDASLKIFFAVTPDPTQLNRHGPDRGTQYRSAIFYTSQEQQRIASGYIGQLENAEVFKSRIVTALAPLMAFHEAEAYHQDYASRHPDQLYILLHDAPKAARLKKLLPGLYVERMTADEVTAR